MYTHSVLVLFLVILRNFLYRVSQNIKHFKIGSSAKETVEGGREKKIRKGPSWKLNSYANLHR